MDWFLRLCAKILRLPEQILRLLDQILRLRDQILRLWCWIQSLQPDSKGSEVDLGGLRYAQGV